MISAEAQRTLVKSPPELWAELSDPASLGRHLEGLGEIRIVRTEPESVIVWEGDGISGAVTLKASGWGTKVTLTASRRPPEPPAPPEPEPEPETEPAVEPEPEPEPVLTATPRATAEPEPEPKVGFFARIFRRRRPKVEPAPEPEPQAEAQPQPEPEAETQPQAETPQEPQPGIAAELLALEESSAAQATAVLTAVLDRLGAAHHRPFSRA